MEVTEFVEKLRRCAPDIKKLEEVGLSEEEAEQFLEGFRCEEAAPTTTTLTELTGDPLIDLVSLYDVSKVEIGTITLVQPVVELDHSWLVGREEGAYVVVDKVTGEVRVEEPNTLNFVIMRCAVNGDSFLSALLPAASFLGIYSYDLELYQDQAAKVAKASQCAGLAGGSEYLDFYNYLLGVE